MEYELHFGERDHRDCHDSCIRVVGEEYIHQSKTIKAAELLQSYHRGLGKDREDRFKYKTT